MKTSIESATRYGGKKTKYFRALTASGKGRRAANALMNGIYSCHLLSVIETVPSLINRTARYGSTLPWHPQPKLKERKKQVNAKKVLAAWLKWKIPKTNETIIKCRLWRFLLKLTTCHQRAGVLDVHLVAILADHWLLITFHRALDVSINEQPSIGVEFEGKAADWRRTKRSSGGRMSRLMDEGAHTLTHVRTDLSDVVEYFLLFCFHSATQMNAWLPIKIRRLWSALRAKP